MLYYAYLNADDICLDIYAMPAPLTGEQYIAVTVKEYNEKNDSALTIIGKRYNRSTGEFEDVTFYYYAVLNEKDIVIDLLRTETAITDAKKIQVTKEQYEAGTLVGKWYDRTDSTFKEAPIILLADHSTNVVNYKDENKWLNAKLDEMDSATAGNTTAILELQKGGTGGGGTGADGKSAYELAVEAGFSGTLSEWLESLQGVDGMDGMDGMDGITPAIGENGNWFVGLVDTGVKAAGADGKDGKDGKDGNAITASEVLEKLKTVDGTGSGLDADTVDGMNASDFATQKQLAGKADTNHTHTGYANATHSHAMNDVTGLSGALANKSDTSHTHSGYANSVHYHNMDDVSGLSTALSNKADYSHTHSEYANVNHSHSEYAGVNHSHSEYLPKSGGTVSGPLNVDSVIRVGNQQSVFNSGTAITLGTNNLPTIIAGSAISANKVISQPSDERLKENINLADPDEMIDFINHVGVKTFTMKNDGSEEIGVIAQEILKAGDIARFFVTEDENGYYGVKYTNFVLPLIMAVQKLTEEVSELKGE